MGAAKMAEKALVLWSFFMGLAANLILVHSSHHGYYTPPTSFSGMQYHDQIRKMQAFKASLVKNHHDSAQVSPQSPIPPSPAQPQGRNDPPEYMVTMYGADPTGKMDSTKALLQAISDALRGPRVGTLIEGISNLGGARINLEGGNYMISKPLGLPVAGVGNLMIHGGTIRASNDFPGDQYLIDLSSPVSVQKEKEGEEEKGNLTDANLSASPAYNYEFVTLKDLMLDSNYRGGGISVVNSLRTSIDNCYIAHFTTNGIMVKGGHETYIRNTFIGQHITAGGDKNERNFSGTGISLMGNDNAVTDVVIFSASVGIMISGQANLISGVHCYNKATGFGGTGIYIKLPGLTQTRIVNSYLDYNGIVAEDPVQLHISNTFFLGDGHILLKAVKGVISGVNIVDNMFSGSNAGVGIVQLNQSISSFKDIKQVVVDRNNVNGMSMKSTVARMSVEGNGSSWTADFSKVLLFPNHIKHVQYSLFLTNACGENFPNHRLSNVSDNRVVVETMEPVSANVFVSVDQGV